MGYLNDFPIWSRWRDLNSRPLVPKTSALPDCATPRQFNVLAARSSWEGEVHDKNSIPHEDVFWYNGTIRRAPLWIQATG